MRPGNGGGGTEYPERYELGLQRLRDVFDLEPVELPTCRMTREELTRDPAARARDVQRAFEDPDLRGVMAVIGGSGEQVRILPHLDGEALRANPTRFFGYSDNTSLALHLWNHGVVSYQGPMLMTQLAANVTIDERTRELARRAFFEDRLGQVEPAARFTDQSLDWADAGNLERSLEWEPAPGWSWWNAGDEVVEGRIWGGCLEVLEINLQVGQHIPPPQELDGTVLALETSEEMPDATFVHRSLMALGERGLLQRFAAVLVGRAKARHSFHDPGPAGRASYRREQREAVQDAIERYAPGTTVVFDVDFGHTDPLVPLPVGGMVQLDPVEERLTFP